MPGDPERLGAVLPGLLKRLGLEERAANAKLAAVWPEAVGPNVARHTKPAELHGGCLTVHVDTPVWKTELERHSRAQILERLRQRDKRIRKLVFRIGEIVP